MYRHNQLLEAMIRNVGNNSRAHNGRFDNHVTEYVCELDVIASHGQKIKIKKKRRMNLIVSTGLSMRKLSCNTTRRIDRFLFRLCVWGDLITYLVVLAAISIHSLLFAVSLL